MKTEQEQIDDQLSDQSSNNFIHASLDQVKRLYNQALSTSTPFSKSSLSMTIDFDKYPNKNGIIPLNNHAIDFRRRRTDLTPVMKSYQPFDDNIYRLF
jgi:hypothetical protein